MANLSNLETIEASSKPTADDFAYIYAESVNKAFIRIAKDELKKIILDGKYTNEEIDQKISTIPKFTTKVVSSLPTTDISETTVYLVSSGDDSENLYTEYININGLWEILGTQKSTFSGNASDVTYDDTETNLGATNVQDAIGKLSETVNDVKRDISLNTDRSKFNRATVDKFNGIFESKFVNVLEYNKLDIITMLDYSKANFLGMYKLLDICPTKTDLAENGISFTYSAIDDHVSETTITIPKSEMHEDTGVLIGIEAESETPVFAVVPENGVVIEGEFIECGFYARLITDEIFLSKVDFGAYDLILYRLKDDMVTEEQLEEAVNDALTQAKESGEFDGVDGYTPIKGEDYFTEADKTEFVEDVLNALPTWTGGSY